MEAPQPTPVENIPTTQPTPTQLLQQPVSNTTLTYVLMAIVGFLVIMLAYVATRPAPLYRVPPSPDTTTPTPTLTTTPTATDTTTVTPSTTVTSTITTTPGATVKVYMFSTTKFNEPNATDYTVSVNRMTTRQDVAAFTIEEIIKGPTSAEQTSQSLSPTFGTGKQIWFTSNSTCNGKDFSVGITNKDATVQFCRGTALAGDTSAYVVEQQIAKTLKQFSTITRVRVLNASGSCLDNMSGLNADQCWNQ